LPPLATKPVATGAERAHHQDDAGIRRGLPDMDWRDAYPAIVSTPVEKLQALVQVPTVSGSGEPFERLLATMREQWPLVLGLEVTPVREHGLLIRWPGRSAERPVVLMAHLDVVPVSGMWTRDPFGGEVVDGAIHGRGTLDDKGCVAAICEAVEGLLADGFVPAYDVWLSLGCDEEVSGGAAEEAVGLLRDRGVTPWFVLDEGGAVAHDAFPGIKAPLAVVGVSEKGTTTLRITASGDGGHASTPARNGPTVRLARAITALDASSMPARIPATTVEMLERLAPHAPLALRPLLSRADALRPLLARALPLGGAEAAALVRTTFAVTTLSGSPAHNVIAASASAEVNIRVMPGDTVADVVAHVERVTGLPVEVVEHGEASPLSPATDDEAFAHLEARIADHFEDAVVTPYIVLAATDSRFFHAISERVYRFAPFRMSREQRASIHGGDEHLGVDDYLTGIAWYRDLIERLP